ncbi:MAG: hypothetical protein EPO65_02785 [Dehalococcoidia bacterium]|nr:MAG: hypothetical protein EPO65_02785 [Dehalococcoidia bacterium]
MSVRLGGKHVQGVFAVAAVTALLLGCSSDKGERRTIAVSANSEACTPARIEVKSGERVAFEVKNGSTGDREFEGIDGTKIDEVLVPAGRTRTINYTVQESTTPLKVKCYIPGGPTTLIELVVTGKAATTGGKDSKEEEESAFKTKKAPKATVDVRLDSFSVKPNEASVAAGPIKFVATNDDAKDVHELAVLRIREDGSLQNTGEIEDIDPKKSGEVVLDLPKGKYQLACLITPGEAGSTVDHYKTGMKVDFEVR